MYIYYIILYYNIASRVPIVFLISFLFIGEVSRSLVVCDSWPVLRLRLLLFDIRWRLHS